MKRKTHFTHWFLLLVLLGFASLRPLAFQQEKKEEGKQEGKQGEPKETDAVDIEDATKQAAQPGPEVGYTKEEYDEFQKALGNPDLKARADGLQQFIKAHPNSKLNEHSLNSIAAVLAQLYQQKDMANLSVVAENFLQLKPDNEAALGYATEAFYANNDYAKAVKYGEAFYAKKPVLGVARLLADSYDKLKNEPKYVTYAEKSVAEMPPKDAFLYSAKLSYYYANQKNIGRAAQHCQRMMSAYGEGEVPPGYTADKWNQEKARSYSIIGRNFYERKQYGNAVAAFNNSLKFYRQNDEALYFMGMSYWHANDPTNAMKYLAKAYNLNKPYAKTARASLESLYKSMHNGSLEGIDRVLRAAATD